MLYMYMREGQVQVEEAFEIKSCELELFFFPDAETPILNELVFRKEDYVQERSQCYKYLRYRKQFSL